MAHERTRRRQRKIDGSASGRHRLKIGQCLAIGKAICCPDRRNSYIATLVERHTRYLMLAKVANKDTRRSRIRAHQAGKEAAE